MNSLPAPTPLNAVANAVPFEDVSIRNCLVDAEPPSPQPAVGSIRNFVMSILSGSLTVIVGGPACGLFASALVGLNADHVVPSDWSIAWAAPQPALAPVSSETCVICAPPLSDDQSRRIAASRTTVEPWLIVTLRAIT